uniref:TIR domain-containing protein n=1 Tax=Salix viminalis TaxID=40686 RepID=A0A6N2KYG0_SALVM
MQKEKRKQSKDEEDDSSSRKRRKADLSKPVSFISTGAMTEQDQSSRSRPNGAYDVFLSFRGEDNRKNFTDHLYTALVQAGIHTFLDDNEIPRGEEISKHLLKAIQESKISIVVFSKGYASTTWCLNELVEILEFKNRKTGQIVLPIFYDIDPSDVRKQTGSFAKAFDKHEECFKEKVKEWRNALEEAGNLSGWNLNDVENRHESKLIQVIIKDVLNKLDPKYINVATNLVGIDRIVQTISDFLSTATNDVCIVGIHGMPGIGKTTIAKVVFNQLCYGFEGSCFLSNINETSKQSNGLVLLQEQLLHDILKQNVSTINNADRGMVLIKERLCHKRVIVVVDDVAQQYQLNALVGERSWFGPGSRVIITTNDERLLLKVDKKCQVEELKRDASLQLFSRHAFKDNKPPKDYVKLSNDVVDYCGGIPLSLEILGSSLFAKNKSRWKCVIAKLRIIPNHDIQEKLRICFDKLDDRKLQKTFLDLACFFIGRNKEYVSNVLEARCGYNLEDDLETLSERSLIKVNASGEISMHNLLRDMGREIIHRESPDHPGKRSRIWQCEDAWNVLSKQMGTGAVEGLVLDVRASENKLLRTGSFTKMRCLKLLQINGVHLSGPFKLLSKELIWICWLECPLKSLPSDLMLDNLVVLEMQYSNIKELWKDKKILNKLKILNLSYSKHLVKTPNLHSSSLEKLLLEGCLGLVEVHQSIGHLKSLIFLNLKGCQRLKTLPQSICNAKSLEVLNISECSQLEKLPEHMGDMESFIELLVDGINEQFLASIEHLKYLRKLSMCGYNFNMDTPSSTSCPSPVSSWISASVLDWKALLPTCFTSWRLLRKLRLAYYGLSERTANCVDLSGLISLEELNLSGNNFFSLPSSISVLPKLQLLRVSDCRNLVSISELPSNLKFLDAIGCKSMERVELPIQSKNNSNLSLQRCPSNHGWIISSDTACDLSNNNKNLVEASYNCYYGYHINDYDARFVMSVRFCKYPSAFIYRGEGCSLTFHTPPVFQGLFFWASTTGMHFSSSHTIKAIIRKKSNGMQIFEARLVIGLYCPLSWSKYVSLSEMAMEEEYCGHEELELYVNLGSEDINMEECGIQVIVDLDSLEAIEWDLDINNNEKKVESDNVIPSPPSHLLYHPLYGSISFTTIEKWNSIWRMFYPFSVYHLPQ